MRHRPFLALATVAALVATVPATSAPAVEASTKKNTQGATRNPAASLHAQRLAYGNRLRNLILIEADQTPALMRLIVFFSQKQITKVKFVVDRNGKLIHTSVLNAGASGILNRHAAQLITQASRKFSPPPAAIANELLPFVISIDYQ